jgi:hypothetical protein
MSVTLVLPGPSPSSGPLSGNNSQSAKFIARAEQLQQETTTQAVGSQGVGTRVNGATQDSAVTKGRNDELEASYADPANVNQFQSALLQARITGATAARSTSATSASNGSRSSIGTALYKRVSQMGGTDPSTSALLRSWNSIMQSGQDGGSSGAATLQTLLPNEAPVFESGGLHFTA